MVETTRGVQAPPMMQRHKVPACFVSVSATRRSSGSWGPENFAGLEEGMGMSASTWVGPQIGILPCRISLGSRRNAGAHRANPVVPGGSTQKRRGKIRKMNEAKKSVPRLYSSPKPGKPMTREAGIWTHEPGKDILCRAIYYQKQTMCPLQCHLSILTAFCS